MSTTTISVEGKGTIPIIGGNSLEPLKDTKLLHFDDVIKRYASIRFDWYELGEAASTIKNQELWKQFEAPKGEEPFHSFDDYILRRSGRSRTAIYRDKQLYEALGMRVEKDKCKAMTQANAIWLQRLFSRLGDNLGKKGKSKHAVEDVIDSALTMKEEDFSKYCNEKLPGAAKEENKQAISFGKCDLSLAKIVDKAVQVAMWESELDDKRDALERLCSFFLESKCEREGFHNLSNQQAYSKSAGRKVKKVN